MVGGCLEWERDKCWQRARLYSCFGRDGDQLERWFSLQHQLYAAIRSGLDELMRSWCTAGAEHVLLESWE